MSSIAPSLSYNIGHEAHRLGSISQDEQDSIEKAVMRILSFHVGRENVISGDRLWGELKSLNFKVSETKIFRDVINKLRKEGWPIGSTGGKRGGYWLCRDRAELSTFIKNQIRPFKNDLREQETAMLRNANAFYGNQISIFEAPDACEVERKQARRLLMVKQSKAKNYRYARGNQ